MPTTTADLPAWIAANIAAGFALGTHTPDGSAPHVTSLELGVAEISATGERVHYCHECEDFADDHTVVLAAQETTAATTAAHDALHAFYAAHPDVENADGDAFLELPEGLTDALDALLLAAAQEKAINEHLAVCSPCREFGLCVTHLPNGTVRCDHGSEDGWDGVRYDNHA